MGSNWLVVTDAYSKYPCIHPTTSTSSKATIELLEQDFAHFGYPHTIVSDNATSFTSDEFQSWCKSKGITHVSGAPYFPATNGAAERLIQSFKNSLRKSSLAPKSALHEFLMQYRRTPLTSGLSPSELLNNRQIRTLIDIVRPSTTTEVPNQDQPKFRVGDPVYARYFGPRREKDPRWIPAVVTKVKGTRNVLVQVSHGSVWRRHIDQLRPRYGADH